MNARYGPLAGPLTRAIPSGSCHVSAWGLPADTAARRARDLLRAHVEGHIACRDVLDDLELVVCELATNAVIHAMGPCELRIVRQAGVPVACEIADGGGGLDQIARRLRFHGAGLGPETAAPAAVESLAEGGRGLGMVSSLTGGRCGAGTAWLYGSGRSGKCVWFAVPASRAPL